MKTWKPQGPCRPFSFSHLGALNALRLSIHTSCMLIPFLEDEGNELGLLFSFPPTRLLSFHFFLQDLLCQPSLFYAPLIHWDHPLLDAG